MNNNFITIALRGLEGLPNFICLAFQRICYVPGNNISPDTKRPKSARGSSRYAPVAVGGVDLRVLQVCHDQLLPSILLPIRRPLIVLSVNVNPTAQPSPHSYK